MQKDNGYVLVTGAGGGSGKATALAFLNAGWSVIASDLKAPEWEYSGSSGLFREALDISDEKAVNALVERYFKDGMVINALVNNAGIAIGVPLTEMSTEIWDKNMKVNAYGTFFCTRAVVSVLVKTGRKGRIVNIGSIAGKNGFPNSAAYCASKAAIHGFTRSLAAELGPLDITVNAICPGTVNTPMIQNVIKEIHEASGRSLEDVEKGMSALIPMGRMQEPEDVAALALFLVEHGDNINGETINLDGGQVRD